MFDRPFTNSLLKPSIGLIKLLNSKKNINPWSANVAKMLHFRDFFEYLFQFLFKKFWENLTSVNAF